MSRLICPECLKAVNVPDDFAGGAVTCPSCHNTFTAPSRYNPTVIPDPGPTPTAPGVGPAVNYSPSAAAGASTEPLMSPENPFDRPAPPPGLVPITPATAPIPAGATPAPPLASGYTRSVGFVISPRVVAWLPAIFLAIAFFCTFFPWVGTYIGGIAVDSQGPWGALFGSSPNRNYELEKLMQAPPGWLDKMRSNWPLLLPGLLALILAVVLAWTDRWVTDVNMLRNARVIQVWPWRHGLLAALAALSFCLILVQVCSGFGLEQAVRQVVTDQFAKEREAASGSPSRLAEVNYNEEQAFAKFNLGHTFWLYLSLVCNFIGFAAEIGLLCFNRRGAKPPPRIVVQY